MPQKPGSCGSPELLLGRASSLPPAACCLLLLLLAALPSGWQISSICPHHTKPLPSHTKPNNAVQCNTCSVASTSCNAHKTIIGKLALLSSCIWHSDIFCRLVECGTKAVVGRMFPHKTFLLHNCPPVYHRHHYSRHSSSRKKYKYKYKCKYKCNFICKYNYKETQTMSSNAVLQCWRLCIKLSEVGGG